MGAVFMLTSRPQWRPGTVDAVVTAMKRTLLLLYSCGLSLVFSSCSSPRAAVAVAGQNQMQSGGDVITGRVVSSSTDHMLIEVNELPEWALAERAAAEVAYASR